MTGHRLLAGDMMNAEVTLTRSDMYAPVDVLLLREPDDRAAHREDLRSNVMRGTGTQRQSWRRQDAGNSLRSSQNGIDDYSEAILNTARLQVSNVE